jgi:DNA-binding CsgD family transcriptional regulator
MPARSAGGEILAVFEFIHSDSPPMRPLRNIDSTPHLLGTLLERWEERTSSSLTPRQRELLTLASHGATTAKIASALSLSPSTVNSHFENIRARLGVPDRTAAVAAALRSGTIA